MVAGTTESLLCEQRYYHFVLLRGPSSLRSEVVWDLMRMGRLLKGRLNDLSNGAFAVEHRRIKTDLDVARGAWRDLASVKGDGKPPYLYDFISIRVTREDETFIAVGFPFVRLGRLMIDRLLEASARPELLSLDIPAVIQELEAVPVTGAFSIQVRSLGLVATTETDLNRLMIGGDDPIHASFYQNVLRRHVVGGDLLPQECSLRCEMKESHQTPVSRARAVIHADSSGYVRFYVHAGASNLPVILPLVEWLKEHRAFSKAASNPMRYARDEGSE